MEKLAYLVWKRESEADEAFKRRLLSGCAPQLLGLEAGLEKLRINVVDDDVAAGAALRINCAPPPLCGLVTFWMEQSQERAPAERVLLEHCERVAGYLVVESRPLVNREQVRPPGERTPGTTIVSCINARPGLSHREFVRIWHEEQRACAIETQDTFQYVRNEVVRPLSDAAPACAAIVEESFPIGALRDPQVFYDAVGDPEKLEANRKRMMDTCAGFLDFSKLESHPMSEYNF